jgi:hypothetical protein
MANRVPHSVGEWVSRTDAERHGGSFGDVRSFLTGISEDFLEEVWGRKTYFEIHIAVF